MTHYCQIAILFGGVIMPRKVRQQSDSDLYHIILRGINRQNIFEDEEDNCLDVGDDYRKTDREARAIIAKLCSVGSPVELQKMEQARRNACLVKLREESYLSIRQIERLTSVSRGIIQKV